MATPEWTERTMNEAVWRFACHIVALGIEDTVVEVSHGGRFSTHHPTALELTNDTVERLIREEM